MKTITLDMLYALGACPKQRNLFAATFGQEAEVTPDACATVASLFDWGWAARTLLSAALLTEFLRQRATLWDDYERQRSVLLAECRRQKAPLSAKFNRDEYQRQVAPLLAACEFQESLLFADHVRQQSRLFAALFNLA